MTFVDSTAVVYSRPVANWGVARSGASCFSGTAQGIASWTHDVEARLRELFLLDDGWDGGYAPRVNPGSIELVHGLLAQIAQVLPTSRRPMVSPTPNGGVAIEWTSTLAHLEIVAEEQRVVLVYDVPSKRLDWEGDFVDAPFNAGQLLYEFFS
jgi:hypothetical protein